MMYKTTFLITIFTLTICQAQNGGIVNESLSKSQLEQDFLIFESSLIKNHPNLDTYTPMNELDSMFTSIKSRFREGTKPIDFYRMLTPILPFIGNNHTNISPPDKYIDFLNTDAKRFPFRLHYYNDTLYVSGDYSDEYIIKEEKILISINGIQVNDIFNDFMANISTDGFNRTEPIIRGSNGFSRYLAYHYGLWDSFKVSYMGPTNTVQYANIRALTRNEIAKNLQKRDKTKARPQEEDYSFEVSQNIGILTIKTFKPNSVQEFRSFLSNTFKKIAEKDIDKLLIDLRDNLGGFPEVSDELLSYLVKDKIHPIKTEYAITDKVHNESHFELNGFLKHFNKKKLIKQGDKYHVKGAKSGVIEPKKKSYGKNLFVLINGNSSSTTGQLLGLIKSYTNALFAGEESGGNPVGIVADDILTLILPNSKIKIKIPMIYSEMNTNFENQGRGIIPDKVISERVEEWMSSEDIVLEKALRWINNL